MKGKKTIIAACILLGITIVDYIVPDPIPFVDEIILSLGTVITGGVGVGKIVKGAVKTNGEEEE